MSTLAGALALVVVSGSLWAQAAEPVGEPTALDQETRVQQLVRESEIARAGTYLAATHRQHPTDQAIRALLAYCQISQASLLTGGLAAEGDEAAQNVVDGLQVLARAFPSPLSAPPKEVVAAAASGWTLGEEPADELTTAEHLRIAQEFIRESETAEASMHLAAAYSNRPSSRQIRAALVYCEMMCAFSLTQGFVQEGDEAAQKVADGLGALLRALFPPASSSEGANGLGISAKVRTVSPEEIAATEWLRVPCRIAASRDGRYLAWTHVATRVGPVDRRTNQLLAKGGGTCIDLQTGDMVAVMAGEPLFFLPGPETILCVKDGRAGHFFSLPGMRPITMYKWRGERKGHFLHPADTWHLCTLPNGIGVSTSPFGDMTVEADLPMANGSKWSVRGGSVSLWEWLPTDAFSLVERQRLSGRMSCLRLRNPSASAYWVGVDETNYPANLLGELHFRGWRGCGDILTNPECTQLLIPVLKGGGGRLPDPTIPAWALVDITSLARPVLVGCVPDSLSQTRYSTSLGTAVLRGRRVWPTDIAMSVGGGLLVERGDDGSVIVTDRTARTVAAWTSRQATAMGLSNAILEFTHPWDLHYEPKSSSHGGFPTFYGTR